MNLLNIALSIIGLLVVIALAIFTGGTTLPFSLPAVAVLLNRLGVKT